MNKHNINKTTTANGVKLFLLFIGIIILAEFVFPYIHRGITIGIIVISILALSLVTFLKLKRDADYNTLKILHNDNNPQAFVEEMHRILETNPQKGQDYMFNINLATGYYRTGDVRQAIELWGQVELDKNALKNSRVRAVLYNNLCEGYLAENNLEIAQIYYDKCAAETKYNKHLLPNLDEKFENAREHPKNFLVE